MSEYFFGLSHNRITRKEARRREQIAKKHGANLSEANIKEGDSPGINNGRYFAWFSCPNRGEPFDSRTRLAVLSEIGIE